MHFFAIDHHDGLVLFDTGLDPAIADDPLQYLGSALGVFFLNRLFRWHSCRTSQPTATDRPRSSG